MVKILFYGGCHALVLRDLFEALFGPDAIETALVVNFELIASGRPFPDALLDWSDVLVFSPIENKGDYNTDRLIEGCRAASSRAICFPWLEWHGYCPGAEKGLFKGRFQWFYPELLKIAGGFDAFDAYVSYVVKHFPDDELIDRTFARTSQLVASAERRHAMPIAISDYIAAHHRSSRLFLISDHPSRALYMHVAAQIAEQIGLSLPQDPETVLPSREPQWRWRTPIFPRVARRLDLAFTDTDWFDDELVPDRSWPLETYLSLYFHRDSVILGPLEPTSIHSPGCDIAQETPVGFDTRIFANPLPTDEDDGLTSYAYIETLAGRAMALDPHAPFKIDAKRWRSTWHF